MDPASASRRLRADRQRYRQVYTNGSVVEMTMYIGEAPAKVTVGNVTDDRHHISDPGYRI